MSKILVDKMPKVTLDCPFASSKVDDDGDFLCMLRDCEYACRLEYGSSCDYLKEISFSDLGFMP